MAVFTAVAPLIALGQDQNPAASLGQVSGQIENEGATTHLEFKGQEQWIYSSKREGNTLRLVVPTLDEATRRRLSVWKDERVLSVQVKSATVGKDEITLNFVSEKIDAFDYTTDQPSRLILDVFVRTAKPAVAATTMPVATGPVGATAMIEVAKKMNKRSLKRKPAGGEILNGANDAGKSPSPKDLYPMVGLADGADPEFLRFAIKDYEIDESSVIRSRSNIYIRFPSLALEEPTLAQIRGAAPTYEIKVEGDDENKKARLLLTLFNRKRYATFLRTLDLFRVDYPVSRYDQILRHLDADVHYELWQEKKDDADFQRAMTLYRALINDYPDSPLRERTWMLLGYTYFDRRQFLPAIQTFETFTTLDKASKFKFRALLGLAQAYQGMGRFKEARDTYKRIWSDPNSGAEGREAEFRLGDSFLAERSYAEALEAYEAAKLKYKDQANQYPNAFFNAAEAKFWLTDNVSALEGYREFLRRFPQHSHGAYALTRIGELLDILGAPPTKSLGAFLESQFRFRNSPGANVARLRLLSKRMPASKPKDVQKEREELNKFVETSDLPGVKDFAVIMTADGFFERGELDTALKLLLAFYQNNTTSQKLDIFRERIIRVIAEQVKQLEKQGDHLGAFRTYGRHAGTWLKASDRIDILFFVGRAFERSGVPSEAAKMYRRVLNELIAVKGTLKEKETSVFEALPALEEVQLRLAAVQMAQGEVAQASAALAGIQNRSKLNPEDIIEATALSSQIAEVRGDVNSALGHLSSLITTWKGHPSLLAPLYIRSAKLMIKTKDFAGAELALDKVLAAAIDLETVSPADHVAALEQRAQLLNRLGRDKESIQTYQSLIEKYSEKFPLGASIYRLGELLYSAGDLKKAEATWAKLDSPETQYWHRMAQEQLKHESWKSEYKKYLQRIPAMNGFNGNPKEKTRGAQ